MQAELQTSDPTIQSRVNELNRPGLNLILYLIIAVVVFCIVWIFSFGYNTGVSSVPVSVPATAGSAAQVRPTPSITVSPFPTTMTVTITGVNGPPTNGFPLAVSSGGQLFDLSSATGPDVSGIIPGAVYDMYVTGEYHPTYNTAETLYTVAWVSLISLPAYPYYGYGYPGNYQGWYQPGQPGTVYSNTVYVNNGQFFLFESDGFYHVVSPDVIQGYQITPGMPPANMIRW